MLLPCRPSLWVVAQLAEHRTVTAVREGSTPFDPPNFDFGMRSADFGLKKLDWRALDARVGVHHQKLESIRNPQSAIEGNCGREVRHLVVNQADDGSSPFSSAMRQ